MQLIWFQVFFFNPTTKKSVWERPPDLVGRADVREMLKSPAAAEKVKKKVVSGGGGNAGGSDDSESDDEAALGGNKKGQIRVFHFSCKWSKSISTKIWLRIQLAKQSTNID